MLTGLMRERGESVANPVASVRASRAVFEEQVETLRAACAGADLLVGTILLLMGPTLAEYLGIPFYWAAHIPHCLPTFELPPPFGFPLWKRPWLNRMVWGVMGAMSKLMARGLLNRHRVRLGLPAIADVYRHMQAHPVLFALDPTLGRPPGDCKKLAAQTGFWFMEQSEPLPTDIKRFIDDGPPPVYIGFGSMPSNAPAAMTRTIVDALVKSGRRTLLSSGWDKLGEGVLPDSCKLVGSLNHQRLLPRMAAVVHHGGAGTTSTAARAGVPQVIVPHMFDQLYWATRMHELGAAPPPLPKKFSAEKLAAAILQATSDTALARAAAEIGEKVRATDGVGATVQFLKRQHGMKK